MARRKRTLFDENKKYSDEQIARRFVALDYVPEKNYPTIYTDLKTSQQFAIYRDSHSGRYKVRFYVDNYAPNGKKRSQRSFCTSKTNAEGYAFAKYVCEHLTRDTAHDYKAIEKIVKQWKKETK